MRTLLYRLFSFTRTRGFDAAGGGRRWEGQRTVDELNTAILAGATTAARRAGWYSRNNPWVAAAVDSLVGNVVGAGIKPQSTHRDRAVRERLQVLWLRWTDHADPSGLADFYGLQAMAVRAMVEGGESFARLRVVPDAMFVPLHIDLLDRDQVPLDLHRDIGGGARVRAGIEFNGAGQRTAYWVMRDRPGDPLTSLRLEPLRLPATDCLHLFKPLAAGQLRGITWLAPVLLRILVTLLEANSGNGPTLSDTKALFHVDHGNKAASGAVISDATLSAARLALRTQKGIDGRIIRVTPKNLLVPPALETVAEKWLATIAPATAADVNPFSGAMSLVVEPRLSSATRWYVTADPGEINGLEFAYLSGNEGPQVESRSGWDVDGVEIRVILDFGAGFIDHRGWFQNVGA
ncbi:phage portal protein [Castellaniella sp.]|uniref:phage portal protein n=1 Tax=Castellaniella sp. TaxID=1955812 RepID=UPI0035674F69